MASTLVSSYQRPPGHVGQKALCHTASARHQKYHSSAYGPSLASIQDRARQLDCTHVLACMRRSGIGAASMLPS